MHFCRSNFSDMVSFWNVLVFLNVFVFVLWVTNIIYQNLMLLNFCCGKTSFLSKHNFFYWWDFFYWWNLDTEVKVFHVSRNAPGTVFHEMLWKKSFTVYPCLNMRRNFRICRRFVPQNRKKHGELVCHVWV